MNSAPLIDWQHYRSVVVLTGAGISVASGIRPYRGPDGVWNDETLVRYSDIDTFRADPAGVWNFWRRIRQVCQRARPNPAHAALARLEARFGAGFCLITQNIDGLHARAGNARLLEYHGNVLRTACSDTACALQPFADSSTDGPAVPLCPLCGAPLRPAIVLFGEAIPEAARIGANRALRACDLFLAVGTSGTVYPAASFVDLARRSGAHTVIVNLEPLSAHGSASCFDRELIGPAERLLPQLIGPD